MSSQILTDRSESVRIPRWHIFARSAAALSLAGTVTLGSILGGAGADQAQTASVGTAAATIVPETSAVYFGFSLDVESPQWMLADELLQRAGAEDSVTSLIDDAATGLTGQESTDASGSDAILGGEAALVVADLEAIAGDVANTASDAGIVTDASDSEDDSSLTSILGGLELPTSDAAEAPGSGTAVILLPADITAATRYVDGELANTASGMDVQVTSNDYNGTEIKSVSGDEMSGETGLAYAVVGDFLVLAEVPEDIQPMIDTEAGAIAPLSGVESFGQADTALAGDRLGFGYLNGVGFESGLDSLDTSGLGLGSAAGNLFGAGGVIGLAIIADPVGFRFNTVEIPADGSSVEAGGAAADLGFADKVPANTLIFVNGFELGKGSLLQALGMALVTAFYSIGSPSSEATPAALPTADELYAQTAMLIGFNLNSDFIQQMVGEYGFALWNVNIEDPSQISALLTSDVEEPATLTDALSKLSLLVQAAGQGQVNVTTRIVNDAAVSSIDITSEGAPVATLEYGVIDGQFMLGVGGGIDEFVAGSSETLADSADYQAALAALPAEYDGIFYVNAAEAVALGTSAMGSSDLGSFDDASAECGEFSTQAAAQEAYDADTVENFILDLDFDGQACEDFFTVATPVVETVSGSDFSAVRAFATVSFKQDGLAQTNSILLIAE